MKLARLLPGFIAILSLAGCAGTRSSPPTAPEARTAVQSPAAGPGAQLASAALELLGTPYRFGGATPAGFDCSGLVQFVHSRIGLQVPRTAAEQHRAARPVPRAELSPGDLVFFRDGGRAVTHVGVYVGDGRFVHAPKTGRPVGHSHLAEEYYLVNFAGAGRLH